MTASGRLADLTVVIPSFNRQSYLERQVKVWSRTAARVEILDGSPTAWAYPQTHSLPENIVYRHDPRPLEARLGSVVDRITTPYAVLLSDDELFIFSALENCIGELARQPDLVACKGLVLGFDATATEVTGQQAYAELRGYQVDQAEPAERLLAHMDPYSMASLWAVMKSEVFKRTLTAIASAGRLGSAATGEIQVSLIAAWIGKCRVRDELMWLRSDENKNTWWDSGKKSFHDWYVEAANAAEVERFLETTIAAARAGAPSDGQLRDALVRALAAYVAWCRRQSFRHARSRVRMRVMGSIPLNVRTGVKKVLASLRGQNTAGIGQPQTLRAAAHDLADTGVAVDYHELDEMIDVIRASHAA